MPVYETTCIAEIKDLDPVQNVLKRGLSVTLGLEAGEVKKQNFLLMPSQQLLLCQGDQL